MSLSTSQVPAKAKSDTVEPLMDLITTLSMAGQPGVMDEARSDAAHTELVALIVTTAAVESSRATGDAIPAPDSVCLTAQDTDPHAAGDTTGGLKQLRAWEKDATHDGAKQPRPDVTLQLYGPSSDISAFLAEVPAFKRLMAIREQGWNSSDGDMYFKNQRTSFVNATQDDCGFYFNMMLGLGEEIQRETSCFKINRRISYNSPPAQILDFCMAPGGFLQVALEVNKYASATAFTLPVQSGGHNVQMDPKALSTRVDLIYHDITFLAADMGVTSIPTDHPDAEHLLITRQIPEGKLFDLVICDGQALRTQELAEWRMPREVRRLQATQLALGLEHMRDWGTMIVLLHKVEKWETVKLLHLFDKFSQVRLFKPRRTHATRSSFYLVARHVRSGTEVARAAVEAWKKEWKVATFGSGEDFKEMVREDDGMAEVVLKEFGAKLARIGTPIWYMQGNALERQTWMKK